MRIRLKPDVIAAMTPGERLKIEAQLRALEASKKRNPLEAYDPLTGKHAAFHLSQDPLKTIFGGNRGGKTTTGVVDDIIQATPWELVPEHLRPYKKHDQCPFFCRVICPDMERTMKPVIHQKLRDWLPRDLLRGGSFDRSYDKTSNSLQLECGCRFDFLSYEMALDKFGGTALHRVHYDEEPPEAIRRECTYRLADFDGDEIFCMTPLQGLSWTYREIWKRRAEPERFVVVVSIHDNHTLSQRAKTRILNETPEEEREAREFGRFVHIGGLVYPGFELCKVPELSLGDIQRATGGGLTDWFEDIVVGLDPGIVNYGQTITGINGDSKATTFDAVKQRNCPVYATDDRMTMVKSIDQMLTKWRLTRNDVTFVIDPAARSRSAVNAETVQGELERFGIMSNWGQNDVEGGVTHMRRRMAMKLYEVTANCVEVFLEAEEYRIDSEAMERAGKFQVIKVNDHLMDPIRYTCMEHPHLPELYDEEPTYGPDVAQPPPRRQDFNSVNGAMV